MDIAIVHYNTPELTRAAILSVRKHCPDADVTVFDNSDQRPFRPWSSNISYIDNTAGRVIDWDAFLAQFPDRVPTCNGHGSAKHARSVDELFDLLPDGFILMDSDCLLKADPSPLADPSVAWSGTCYANRWVARERIPRLLPMLCWLNVPLCRSHGVRYFDPERSWKLKPRQFWDTGASFLADCDAAQLTGRSRNIWRFVEHYGHGSWNGEDPAQWLEENKNLYI